MTIVSSESTVKADGEARTVSLRRRAVVSAWVVYRSDPGDCDRLRDYKYNGENLSTAAIVRQDVTSISKTIEIMTILLYWKTG